MLLDKINQHTGSSITDSALLGPFYVVGRPSADNGSDISDGVSGTPMFVTGRVLDEGGNPIAGAKVDIWHSDGEGFYDVEQTEKLHDQFAMRALLTTDDDGGFWYRSITPRYYPVPTDGPCGEILRAANRSPMRPQHVHFWFTASGYQPLITQLFWRDDPYIGHDAVFADQDSLMADFVRPRARARSGRSFRRRAVRDAGLDVYTDRRIRQGRKQMSRIPLVDIEQQPEPVREFMVRSRAVNVLRVLANAPDVFAGLDADGRRIVREPDLQPADAGVGHPAGGPAAELALRTRPSHRDGPRRRPDRRPDQRHRRDRRLRRGRLRATQNESSSTSSPNCAVTRRLSEASFTKAHSHLWR